MDASVTSIILFTLAIAALSTVTVMPAGTVVAWTLARGHWRGKSVVETLLALPLVVPPVATGLILLKIFSHRSPVGAWLESVGVDVLFTWRGVWIATSVMAFPLFVRSARVAIESVDPRLEQVARTLGAGRWRVFREVTLPLAKRGLVAGTLLAFARALGEFGATIMVAGFIPGKTATLALAIYHYVQLGDDRTAFALLLVSVAIAFGAVWASEHFLRRRVE